MSVTRKGRRILAGIAASTLLAGVVVGTSTSAANAASKSGGTLLFVSYAEQLDHLDPQRIYTGRDIAFVNTYLFRNLVSFKMVPGNKGFELTPDLATNTGVASKDAKTWKFTLRPGVTFQDGSPITCADLKYGMSRSFATDVITDGPGYAVQWLDIPSTKDATGTEVSAYAGPYKGTGQAYYDKAVTCSKDNRTITYRLKSTVTDFNYYMTYPAGGSPVKKSKDTGEKYDIMPMATGPYKIAKYKFNDELLLVRNKAWKKSSDPIRTPYPDEVDLRLGIAEDVRDQIFLNDSIPNAVDFDGLLPVNNAAFFGDPTKAKQRLNVFDPYVRYYAMNTSKLPCLDTRKAIFYAYNAQAIIDLYGGTTFYGEPGDSPVKPNLLPDYAPTTGNIHDPNWKITGNPDYAKTFLAKAKTSCPAEYDHLTNPDKGIYLDLANGATARKVTALVKSAMEKAGIVVKFNLLPPGAYYSIVQDETKQGDMSRVGWGADWPNASTVIPQLFNKGYPFNLTQNYKDPAYPGYIAIVDKALAEQNRAKQAKLWQQAAQYVMDQYWMSNVIFGKQQLVWGSGVGGVDYWGPQGTFLFPTMYIKAAAQ